MANPKASNSGNGSGEGGPSLQDILNPKPKISSLTTFAHVLWLHRYWVLGVWLLLGLPPAIFLSVYDLPQDYWTSTTMRFPDVVGAEQNMVRDVSVSELESVVSIFESRKVLTKTIDDMKLQFQITTKDLFRRDVFQSISYAGNANIGEYFFNVSGRNLEVEYKHPKSKAKSVIFRGQVPAENAVTLGGITVQFAPQILSVGDVKFQARFVPMEIVVENLRKKIGVRALDLNSRVKVNYKIFLEDRDPFLVAETLNQLVQNFVAVFSGITEVQDIQVLNQMEKNLELAREKEKKAQTELADFYTKHPYLLGAAQQNNTYALVQAQTEKQQYAEKLDEIARLWARRPAAGSDADKRVWMSDAVNLLNSFGVVQMLSIQERIKQFDDKKTALSAEFPPTHPKILALEAAAAALYPDVEKAVSDYQGVLQTKLGRLNSEIAKNLPQNAPVSTDLEAKRLDAEKQNASRIVENLQSNYDRAKLSTGGDFFKVTIVDTAEYAKYNPPGLARRLAFSLAALIVAFFPGFFFFIARQALFGRIWNRDDAERKLGVKVVGSIFFVHSKNERDKTQRLKVEDRLLHSGEASTLEQIENFRSLRAEVENYYGNSGGHLDLLITSTQPFEGKSLISANLAISFARKKRRTLLIDADFRHGRQEQIFQLQDRNGLSDLLEESGLDPEGHKNLVFGTICATAEQGLFLLPKGRLLEKGAEAITQSKINAIIALLQSDFDVVIVDTPPVIVAADAFNLMTVMPNVLFVTRSGAVSASDAEESIALIRDRDVKLACVVNLVENSPYMKNNYSKYGYYYTP